jgi:succinate-acetate transporter protein
VAGATITRPLTEGSFVSTSAERDPVVAPPAAPTTWGAGIADPGPLGLAGFAGTTFVLSVVNSNLLPMSVVGVVFGLAFFYGGLAQLLAGMWEFTKGNTFGALAFSSFGAFWLSFWYLNNNVPKGAKPTDLNHAIGTYLLLWTIFTAYMCIPALRTTGAILAVFVTLTLTFLFLSIGAFGAHEDMTKVGGWLGLVTAVLAWYASLAGVTNATWKRVVLPTFPLA